MPRRLRTSAAELRLTMRSAWRSMALLAIPRARPLREAPTVGRQAFPPAYVPSVEHRILAHQRVIGGAADSGLVQQRLQRDPSL